MRKVDGDSMVHSQVASQQVTLIPLVRKKVCENSSYILF